jgi:chromosomal replication initiation ATPase DnaA
VLDPNVWDRVLATIRAEVSAEDFYRWFGATSYASDSGDLITVWVPSESIRRHIMAHYLDSIFRALDAMGRPDANVRLVVAGFGDDEESDEDD